MRKIEISIIIALIFSISVMNYTGFAQDVEDIRNNVLRIHILANSNSKEDQDLKIQVRDKIIEETSRLFLGATTQEVAKQAAVDNIDLIKGVAQQEVYDNGYNYKVDVEILNTRFTARNYGEVVMPSGNYDAIRIKLGESEGDNWWCVIYPVMCLPASSSRDITFTDKQVDILENNHKYKVKFAFVEVFEKIIKKFESKNKNHT